MPWFSVQIFMVPRSLGLSLEGQSSRFQPHELCWFGNPFVFPCKAIVSFTSVIFKWNKLRLEWNLVQTLMFTKVRFLSFFHCACVQASTLALHLASAGICICLLANFDGEFGEEFTCWGEMWASCSLLKFMSHVLFRMGKRAQSVLYI